MATIKGVNATKIAAEPKQFVAPGQAGGKIQVIYDTYTVTAAIDTTDFLLMGSKIPAGARVVDAIVKSSDLGGTGDINVGWLVSDDAVEAADADGFFAALDVNAVADGYSMIGSAFGNNAGLFKKFESSVQAVIAPSEITTATSGDISLAIYYVQE